MSISAQLAKHLRDVHFGGNWTSVNLKDTLSGIDWQQATTKTDSLNTIALLVYHMHYYVAAILKVMQGGPLDAKDQYSFDLPPLQTQMDWERLQQSVWTDAEDLAKLVESLPEEKLWENFAGEKYGTVYRNIQGLIEHTHYHLGQIALIKKLLPEKSPARS
ncbi:MAG TPA: DUF1572 domain-containing protein [Flavisolibacter sp.]|nr:DUF1572 domain-containing protein [Flavisolibacter sp.]